MIGLRHLMAGDDSRMAGGESRMTGDCCLPEGSIHRCVRTHSHLYSHIYGLVALLDNIQSSFSSITISTQKARIYRDLTPISVCIPVCTDMSRSPEAYPHILTVYQTDLRLTMQVHMQHRQKAIGPSENMCKCIPIPAILLLAISLTAICSVQARFIPRVNSSRRR